MKHRVIRFQCRFPVITESIAYTYDLLWKCSRFSFVPKNPRDGGLKAFCTKCTLSCTGFSTNSTWLCNNLCYRLMFLQPLFYVLLILMTCIQLSILSVSNEQTVMILYIPGYMNTQIWLVRRCWLHFYNRSSDCKTNHRRVLMHMV